MHDIVIRGGEIIDGSGRPARVADVAVQRGRIVAISTGEFGPAHRVIDARGRVVAPGFIDVKTHSDFTLPFTPRADSKVRQGVTTEVVGHCGFSVAPVIPGRAELLREYLAAFAPWIVVREASFGDYMATFPPTAVNTIFQVGHNTLRLMAMGMENRPPGGEETALMRRLLEEALAAGALGLSSGLFTPPGSFATSDELIALGQILRPYGASYATHLRDEASGLFDAVREAVRFGEACGVHVQLVHLKLSGVDNWGQADQLLAEIEAARAGGIRIDADHYPYTAAGNPLRNLLPTWVQDGGLVAMLRRLAEPSTRDRIRQQIAADGLNSFGRISSWDAVSVANSPRQPDTVGQTIAGVARARGCDPIDALCDNLIADGGGGYVLITSVSEEDVREFLRSPTMLVGSDGRAVAPDSVTGQGKPHPRFYGTFPRVLGHYVRDLGLLPLPQAIFKMTGGSARALGLADRGFVREGYQADLTVFEPGSIADRATYDEPQRFPAGIANVMVNGVVVVDEGEHTGALPGQVLRRRADGSVR